MTFSPIPTIADPYVSHVECYHSNLMLDESRWPTCVRRIGESLRDHWSEEAPNDLGCLEVARAFMYGIPLALPAKGPDTEPFGPFDDPPFATYLSDVPARTLELWSDCLAKISHAPLATARLADLLRARGHGDAAKRSCDAVDAYLQIADLHQVAVSERLSGLLRALEICREDALGERYARVLRRLRQFVGEHAEDPSFPRIGMLDPPQKD